MFNFGFWMEDGRPQLAYSPVYQCSVYQLASLRISLFGRRSDLFA
jgi:hypothetical protein